MKDPTENIRQSNLSRRAMIRGLACTVAATPLSMLSGGAMAQVAFTAGKELVFVPYFDVQLESYNTYFRKA